MPIDNPGSNIYYHIIRMLNNIGVPEIVIIGIVLVVLFGSKKVADVAGTLGKTTKELKKARTEYDKALTGTADDLLEIKTQDTNNSMKTKNKVEKKEVEEDV